MKIFFTVLVVLAFLLVIWAMWFPQSDNPYKSIFQNGVFKIKVVPKEFESGVKWEVHYTNNNWGSTEKVDQLTDYTRNFNYICLDIHSEWFSSEEEAISFAKNHCSYSSCGDYNKKLLNEYEGKLKLYNEMGIPEKDPTAKKEKLKLTEKEINCYD